MTGRVRARARVHVKNVRVCAPPSRKADLGGTLRLWVRRPGKGPAVRSLPPSSGPLSESPSSSRPAGQGTRRLWRLGVGAARPPARRDGPPFRVVQVFAAFRGAEFIGKSEIRLSTVIGNPAVDRAGPCPGRPNPWDFSTAMGFLDPRSRFLNPRTARAQSALQSSETKDCHGIGLGGSNDPGPWHFLSGSLNSRWRSRLTGSS